MQLEDADQRHCECWDVDAEIQSLGSWLFFELGKCRMCADENNPFYLHVFLYAQLHSLSDL